MRKSFSQVLKEGKVDIKKEYQRLCELFYITNIYNYSGRSACDIVTWNFKSVCFRGTCLTLEDFNETYGFHFEMYPENFDVDYLVKFCEYSINLIMSVCGDFNEYFLQLFLKQIDNVIEKIGYMRADDNGYINYVEKLPSAMSVSEILPAPTSYKVILYNHHSLKGKIIEKNAILNQLYLLLEPKRNKLHQVDSKLENTIFYCFNNLNIRHENTTAGHTHCKDYIANMSASELEKWYDETYKMCLLAFLELEQIERANEFQELKNKIEMKNE